MAKRVRSILFLVLLALVSSSTWADERARFKDENERRWNKPPSELTPESVVETSDNGKHQPYLHSLNPVTTAINSNNAENNNAHSVSLGGSLDGISLSESSSYSLPTRYGFPVSISKTTTLSAGLSGISTAGAEAHSNGNNAKTESHSLSLGQAAATSFGVIENGHATTGAASSVGTSQSFAASDGDGGGSRGQSFSQTGPVIAQYGQKRPSWSNVGPSNVYNGQHLSRPTLTISRPYDGIQPLTLNIDAQGTIGRDQKPTIHIYKWRPNHRVFPRPSLSIEHHELRPYDSWNDRAYRSTSDLRTGIVMPLP